MIVLGLDTATPATAVGLRLADGTTLRAYDEQASGERPGHTTRSLPLAAELLAEAGVRWDAIERIAVGVGPGTFTGLRVGVATARGLAQSLGVDVVGVSTPRVLAEAALRARQARGAREAAGVEGVLGLRMGVLAVIDARRGEAFAAAYGEQAGLSVEARPAPPAPAHGLPVEDGRRQRSHTSCRSKVGRRRGCSRRRSLDAPRRWSMRSATGWR